MNGDNIHGIHLENVWNNKSPELTEEIIDTWKKVGLKTQIHELEQRANQVVYIARAQNHELVSISTAFPFYSNLMRNYLFFFRSLVRDEYKIPGLLAKMTKSTLEYLESIHEKVQPKCIGVLTEIENPELKKYNLVHMPSGFTFIGYSSRNNPMRVYFFHGARY